MSKIRRSITAAGVESHAAESGFTFVEVLAAAAVLSLLVLCTVHMGDVYGRVTGDLLLRQKAVFVINGEMERLSALYNTTTFGTLSLPQLTGYPALQGLPTSSSRTAYTAGNALTPFVTTSAATFAAADTYVWATGLPVSADYVWLDRDRNAMARISWITCPINANLAAACFGGKTATGPNSYTCYPMSGVGSGTCYLLDLILDYPFWLNAGSAVAGPTLTTMTLSTIVGRRK